MVHIALLVFQYKKEVSLIFLSFQYNMRNTTLIFNLIQRIQRYCQS